MIEPTLAELFVKSLHCSLRYLDLLDQIGMAIQHLEQFDQRQGRLGFAVLVARESIDAAEDLSGLALFGQPPSALS